MTVSVRAEDDVAVAEIRPVVSGAVSATFTRPIVPPGSPVVVEFEVAVPADAPGGALTFAAVAVDTKGQSSAAAVMVLTVADDIDPEVSIPSPAAGTVILPGTSSLNVTVRALDAGRVCEPGIGKQLGGLFGWRIDRSCREDDRAVVIAGLGTNRTRRLIEIDVDA